MAINPLNAGVPVYSPIRPHTDIESDRETSDKPIEESAKKSASGDSTQKQKDSDEANSKNSAQLSDEEKRLVQELKQRDREVRAHEQAHKSAAGSLAQGGATFSYVNGPDGKRYANGGEVSIDTSPVSGDPAATIQKAARIRQAALAPAQPSSQDMRVAANASQMAQEARAELSQERRESTTEADENRDVDATNSRQEEVAGAFQSNATDGDDNGSSLDISV